MRRPILFVVALTAYAHADPDDHAWAERMAMTARTLARDGHCKQALEYRDAIVARDPEVWREAASGDAHLSACLGGTTLSATAIIGGPSTIDPVVPPPEAPDRGCHSTGYFEPSLLFGPFGSPNATGMFHRIATGMLVRSCDSPYRARLGGTVFATHNRVGFGFEAELAYRASDFSHVGVHVALEQTSDDHGAIVSFDARYHFDDILWLQVGGFHSTAYDYNIPSYGVAAGLGLEGKPGAITSAIEVSVVTTLFGMLVYACSTGGCGD